MVIPNQRKLHALFVRLLRVRVSFRAIVAWAPSNRLHLNSSKIDVIWFNTDSKRHLIPTIPLHLNGADVVPSETVRNLGSYFGLDNG